MCDPGWDGLSDNGRTMAHSLKVVASRDYTPSVHFAAELVYAALGPAMIAQTPGKPN